MTHVWQSYHGNNNLTSAIGLWLHRDNYEDAYYYDLTKSKKFSTYNFEQQASIVADYWYVSVGRGPQYNIGTDEGLAAYRPFVTQVQSAGVAWSGPGKRDPDKEIGHFI
jgi:hypothetical protein